MSNATSFRLGRSGETQRRILLLCNGTAQQTTGRLFIEMARRLSEQHDVVLQLRSFPTGILRKIPQFIATEFRNGCRILSFDVLVVHSALSLSIATMICAKLARCKIVAFVWDFYPTPQALDARKGLPLLRSFYGAVEALAYRLADEICVPTTDYSQFKALKGIWDVKLVPLWTGEEPCSPSKAQPLDRIHLAFAGQINAIRGLDTSIQSLLSGEGRKIVLELFSKDAVPENLAKLAREGRAGLEIRHHGFVDPLTLQNKLGHMDFGLIPIDHSFPLPAFPSKALTYLSAGVPILYDGPPMPGMESIFDEYGIGMTSEQFARMTDAELVEWRTGFLSRRNLYLENLEREWCNFAKIL